MLSLPQISDIDWNNTNNYISKSRLNLWFFCEIKYRKQYVEKCLPRKDTHATSIGTRYHNFMEIFMGVADQYPVEKWMDFIHPDFTDEEVSMLKWSIRREIDRYNENPLYWKPIALEYKIIDHTHNLRGIIDRIDQVDDHTIEILEYKTSKKADKRKLQLEFGFYDLLLDSVEELKGYKRKYTVIYPRLQQAITLKPSRHSTIMGHIDKILSAIENDKFTPTCGFDIHTYTPEYATSFCTLCSLEDIARYNEIVNYRGG